MYSEPYQTFKQGFFFGRWLLAITGAQDENITVARAPWKPKCISILYLSIMLKEIRKDKTLGYVIAYLQNVCKITWTKPIPGKSTRF